MGIKVCADCVYHVRTPDIIRGEELRCVREEVNATCAGFLVARDANAAQTCGHARYNSALCGVSGRYYIPLPKTVKNIVAEIE